MTTQDTPAQEDDPGKNACTVGVIISKNGKESRKQITIAHSAMARTYQRVGYAVDGRTSDGVGFEYRIGEGLQNFFADRYKEKSGSEPANGKLAIGNIWLPRDQKLRTQIMDFIHEELNAAGYNGEIWRENQSELLDVSYMGEIGLARLPQFLQILLPLKENQAPEEAEKELILIRERVLKQVQEQKLTRKDPDSCHFASFSAQRIIYASRSDPKDHNQFFKDTQQENFITNMVKLHGRFSTKGETELKNIQPLPNGLAHNGTGVTITGLRAAMPSHYPRLLNAAGAQAEPFFPVMRAGNSDSADLDRLLAIEEIGGTSLPEFKMKYLPKSASDDTEAPQEVKNTKRVLAAQAEAFDGPAFVILTSMDGDYILVTLDANGLRPAMAVETEQYITYGSEAGMWGFDVSEIIRSDELDRGEMQMVNIKTGRIYSESELETFVATQTTHAKQAGFIEEFTYDPNKATYTALSKKELNEKLRLSGYSDEDISKMLNGMIAEKAEPKGSMGRQNRRAARGPNFRPWSHYYTELHEQIVAPPHNSELDSDIMDLTAYTGKPLDNEGNPRRVVRVHNRFTLTETMYNQLREQIGEEKFQLIDCTFNIQKDENAYENALSRIEATALHAAKEGKHIILSDEEAGPKRAQIMMDHAIGVSNNILNLAGLRGGVSIFLRDSYIHTGHDAFIAKSAGADFVVPYLAEKAAIQLSTERKVFTKKGEKISLTPEEAVNNFHAALSKSILVSMQRTGTIRGTSVRGAHQFESYGIDESVINRVHPGLPNRGKGLNFKEIQKRILAHHQKIYNPSAMDLVTNLRRRADGSIPLNEGGRFTKVSPDTEPHAHDQKSVSLLHEAVQHHDFESGFRIWKAYSAYVHSMGQERGIYPRDDWRFKKNRKPVPLDEVEPLGNLTKRFVSQAMSIGALNVRVHKDIHYAINTLPRDPQTDEGAESNTGEGGYDQELLGTEYQPAVVQWSTGAFGIRPELIRTAKIIELKFGQGAKTGVGGAVDPEKITEYEAALRFVEPGTPLYSPPQHMDMLSIEDLKQKIKYILSINPEAEIRIKIVAKDGCDSDAVGAAKAMRNAIEELKDTIPGLKGKMSIVLAGNSGGTGNARKNDIQYSGAEWESYLPLVKKALIEDGHDDVKLIVDGGLRSGLDMALGAVSGADKCGFGTLIMYALGCLDQGKCETNECMTGIATTNKNLIDSAYKGKPEQITRLVQYMLMELREIMAENGFRSYDEMIGADCLDNVAPYCIDAMENFSLLHTAIKTRGPKRRTKATEKIRENLKNPSIDSQMRIAAPNIVNGEPIIATFSNVDNTQVAIGSNIAGDLSLYILSKTRNIRERVLPDDHVVINLLNSTPGYATGGMIVQGMTLNLTGLAGDSIGVNNRGGIIVVNIPKGLLSIQGAKILLAGNLANGFTTGGASFINGVAGHNASFRQSGGLHVYKGTRSKAAQFKTGGDFIAWKYGVGRNSFANHTGGHSFVREEGKTFAQIKAKFNRAAYTQNHITPLTDPVAIFSLRAHLEKAFVRTRDNELGEILTNFNAYIEEFVHVRPEKGYSPSPIQSLQLA